MKLSGYFIVGLSVVFFILGFNALQSAKPKEKNERVYMALSQYNPYSLEKRIGGFSILSKEDNIKEKPPITEVYSRLEQLEKGWGMRSLKIQSNKLNVYDNNNTLVHTILFQNKEEKSWTQEYFNIK